MLNELHQIHRALVASGHALGEPPHPDISSIQKGPLLHLRLDKQGNAVAVEFRNGEGMLKIGNGNKNSFPAVRVQRPLLELTSAQAEEFNKAKGDLWPRLKAAQQTYGIDAGRARQWPGEGYRRRVKERFDALEALAGSDAEVVLEAAKRFGLATEHSDTFLSQCVDLLMRQNLDKNQARLVSDLWIGRVDRNTGETKAACVLYFDVDSWDGFDHDAADPASFRDITRALASASRKDDASTVCCAVTGIAGRRFEGNFPRPTLGFLGPTYLYSRNDDTPTLGRYLRSGNEAICITEQTVNATRSAAETITSADREGRTWARIPSERAGDPDLLWAFVPAQPDAPVAGAITAENTDGPMFKEFASKVLNAFKGRVSDHRSAEVFFYILRRVDPGNSKVVYSTSGSVGRLLDAAERWSGFCSDLPSLGPEWRILDKEDVQPPRLAPSQFVGLSRTQYRDGGKEKQKGKTGNDRTTGCTFGQMLAFFWGDDTQRAQTAGIVLSLLLRRRGILLSGAKHAVTRRTRTELKKFHLPEVAETVSALHILLSIKGRIKETYMNDAAFRLGQLLAAADVLHKGYCFAVRKGQVPSVLMGNAALATAQANPVRALDILGRRWRVYHAWASKAKMPDKGKDFEIRDGVYAAYHARALAESLHGQLGIATDEIFRAELLLGYVAGPPRGKQIAVEPTTEELKGDQNV